MNTEITLTDIMTMFPSESTYRTFVDIFNDMELELTDMTVA